jgi:hypothetical protein
MFEILMDFVVKFTLAHLPLLLAALNGRTGLAREIIIGRSGWNYAPEISAHC